MASLNDRKELVTLRVPRKAMDEVRSIAAREEETQSAIIRRLLRRGLQGEVRQPVEAA